MNQKAFEKYLATGQLVSSEDAKPFSPDEYIAEFKDYFGCADDYEPTRTYGGAANSIARECAIRAPWDTMARDNNVDVVIMLVKSGNEEGIKAGKALGDCMMKKGKHDNETLLKRMSDAYKFLFEFDGLAPGEEENVVVAQDAAISKYLSLDKPTEAQPTEDQDTAVSDSFVEAAVMVYQAANMVNRCIEEHNPWGIDLEEIREAELALAYVQGIRHGLALDVKMDREYLLYMEKSVASMKESRATGFRFPVYVPPNPFEILNIMQRDFINRKSYATHFSPPSEKEIAEAQNETDKVKNGNCPYTRDPYKNNEPSGENLPENPKSGLNNPVYRMVEPEAPEVAPEAKND